MNKYFQLHDEMHALQGLLPLPTSQRIELILENVKANGYKNHAELIEQDIKASKDMTMEDVYADLLQVKTRKKSEEEADDEDAACGTWVICRVEQVLSLALPPFRKGVQ
jgi:hypothetical protein